MRARSEASTRMSEGTPPPPPPENPAGSQPPSGGAPPPPADPIPPVSPQPGGYAAAPPPPQVSPTGPQPGNLLDRFLARLIDGILVGVVNAIIISVLIAGVFGLSGAGAFNYGAGFAAAAVSAVVGVVLNLGYFAFMESSQGRTLGKMVMKLHVQGASGGKPTLEESIKRNWWLALGLAGIVPFLGFVGAIAELVIVIMIAVQINSDPERRPALSDRFADTRVIKEG